MAKVSLNKITPTKSKDKKTITLNGEEVTVTQYLPVAEKLGIYERAIGGALDNESYYISRTRLEVCFALEVIRAYTNINLTDKMMEEAPKTYDALVVNGVWHEIVNAIPQEEYSSLSLGLYDESDHFEKHLHSFSQMLKLIAQDYSNTEMDTEKLMEMYKDPEAFKMIRDILEKIG